MVRFGIKNQLLLNAKATPKLSRGLCKLTPSGLIRPLLTEFRLFPQLKSPRKSICLCLHEDTPNSKEDSCFSKNKRSGALLPTFKGKGVMRDNRTHAMPHPASLATVCLWSSQVIAPLSQGIQPSLGTFPGIEGKHLFSPSRVLCLALNK